jgi:hypothetical protein
MLQGLYDSSTCQQLEAAATCQQLVCSCQQDPSGFALGMLMLQGDWVYPHADVLLPPLCPALYLTSRSCCHCFAAAVLPLLCLVELCCRQCVPEARVRAALDSTGSRWLQQPVGAAAMKGSRKLCYLRAWGVCYRIVRHRLTDRADGIRYRDDCT